MVREIDATEREATRVTYGCVARKRVHFSCCDAVKRGCANGRISGRVAVAFFWFLEIHQEEAEMGHAAKGIGLKQDFSFRHGAGGRPHSP
jgi:hypothetical protein